MLNLCPHDMRKKTMKPNNNVSVTLKKLAFSPMVVAYPEHHALTSCRKLGLSQTKHRQTFSLLTTYSDESDQWNGWMHTVLNSAVHRVF